MRNGYQHMVLDDLVERVRQMREARASEMRALRTKEDALAFQAKVRASLADSFGPWPEKCALEPVVTGTLPQDGYRIEHVRYCSRPGFWVTGSLYIPDNLKGPAPASLGVCGHSSDGKACDTYQNFAVRLVRNGFVVLLYDPIHQGERKQYPGMENLGQAASLCGAHNVMDKQLELLGEGFPSWRVWDGIRSLDYLLTRPEVDPCRIGITGNSGGGTLTEWIWSNESRLAFAAPSCHVTSFLGNLENELPTDAEQCPYRVLAHGLEMVDLMIAQAPKPVLLLGQKYDFFERRGLQWAYMELKHFYSLFGAEDQCQLFIGSHGHGYHDDNQESMVKFFTKAAGQEFGELDLRPGDIGEAELFVTKEGNVNLAGSKPIYQLLAEKAAKLAATRVAPKSGEWGTVLAELLNIPSLPMSAPHFRIPRAYLLNGKVWSRYAVETERSIRAILHKRLVEEGKSNTLDVEEEVNLYLPDYSSELDAQDAVLKELVPGQAVYALDPRGMGESAPEEASGDNWQPYGMDYMMHSFHLMFGQSYFGRRVFDVLRTIQLLQSEGARTIHIFGRGQGAILAAFTAMLCPAVADVALYEAPASFREWIDNKVCDWPVSSVPRGVLLHFDLPDLYAALGGRLTIHSNLDAMRK